MRQIATLGPAGTYSEEACIRFIRHLEDACKIQFYPSVKKVISAIDHDADLGVIPIENFSRGYVSMILDALAEHDIKIFAEVLLPIRFSYVSNTERKSEVEKLFVQFVAENQCDEFLDQFRDIDIVRTQSNMLSLKRLKRCERPAAAIIPTAAAFDERGAYVEHGVADYKENQTRFLALGKPSLSLTVKHNDEAAFKTSVIVFNDKDCPGALSGILRCFANRGVNLLSIISRPTRRVFGQYFFYIDLEGHQQCRNLAAALEAVSRQHRLKVLGSYRKLKI